QSH
ncbi:hypothetical protein VCAG7404_003059B, partial [Vibrio cholerae O1 str. AG-7404]